MTGTPITENDHVDLIARLDDLIFREQVALVQDRGGDTNFVLSNITDRILAEIWKTHNIVKK